jgi:hypothetical protein
VVELYTAEHEEQKERSGKKYKRKYCEKKELDCFYLLGHNAL